MTTLEPRSSNPVQGSTLPALPLIATLLLLTGCSSTPPEPIRIGSAPATPTGKVDLSVPLDSSGFLEFDKWPDACDLLTDRDVRAVFPQARDIRRKREDQKLTILGNLLSTAPAPPPQDVTVENASCRVSFSLPGVEREEEFPDSTGYAVTVKVDYAGKQEVVRDNASIDDDEPRVRLGGAECNLRLGDFSCVKGKLAFALSPGITADQGKQDGKLTMRYQRGSEITTFQRPGDAAERGGAESIRTQRRQSKFEDDHIRSELVKAVASKI